MKKKNVAAIFGLLLGAFGVHRFYLGQIGLGIFYVLLSVVSLGTLSSIIGIIDAIMLFSMDQAKFDSKYNGADPYSRRTTQYNRPTQRQEQQGERPAKSARYIDHRKAKPGRTAPTSRANNPHKVAGIAKYKDYDFLGAITDFEKALNVDSKDVAVHFNIACAYSITENVEEAFFHLSEAVRYGFSDLEKIKEHDALAYLRIQEEFEAFEQNGYRLANAAKENTNPPPEISGNLLEQIKRLGELKEKGFLTSEEFVEQKRKLLR